MPGFHWNKNYACQNIEFTPPPQGKIIKLYQCPRCSKIVKIKIPSSSRGTRIRIIFGILGLITILFIIFLFIADFSTTNISSDAIIVIRVWGTIIGAVIAINFISNALSSWYCYYPKIVKDIHLIFFKHKFFHTGD